MSEAARRTYFHFSPSPRGEWRTSSPDSTGYFWVTWRPAGDSECRVTLVHYQCEEKCALPAGFELLAKEDLKAIPLDEIQAWWSGQLTPPPTSAK
ncbi:MAG: hypothetical protein ACI8TQ_003433 [Planctomycetota bacterium]|jgi:hypothetical protein